MAFPAFYHDMSETLSSVSARITSDPTLSITAVFVTLFLIASTTRLLTGSLSHASAKTKSANGITPIPMLPYWTPVFGHVFSFLLNFNGLLRGARDDPANSCGAYSLKIVGHTHNIIFKPSLIKAVMLQRAPTVEYDSFIWYVVNRVFGAPSNIKERYLATFPQFHSIDSATILRGPNLTAMVTSAVDRITRQLPNLVSCMSSPVDQSLWERVAGPVVVEDGKAVEVDLFALMREFLGHQATPSLMGQAFMDNNPDVLQCMWALDDGLKWLMTGLPRWFPILPLTRAQIAKRKLGNMMTVWHEAYDKTVKGEDPGSEWRDMDADISEWMRQRAVVWRKEGFTPAERAAGDIAVLYGMLTNANLACPWLLIRILSSATQDPTLIPTILAEIDPHTHVTVPPPILSHQSPPVLKVSPEKLVSECPTFRAAYLEALRMNAAPFSVKRIDRDFQITSSPEAGEAGPRATLQLKKGQHVLISHDVHQTDPKYFPSPEVFNPHRFLTTDEEGKLTVDVGTMRPYGGGPTMCKGRFFAEREILSYVAGMLRLWDIEPVGADGGVGEWVVPEGRKMSAVQMCKKDIRVRLRRKEFRQDAGVEVQ